MIRGPRFGLGTCRYCCRWIFLLVALAALLPLFVHMQLAAQVPRISADLSSGAQRPSSAIRRTTGAEHVASTASTGYTSNASNASNASTVRRRRQQQAQQQQGLSVHRKHRPGVGVGHDHAGSIVAEEGSILRLLSKNNLYIQSFPNGTVSATGHDSSYYSVLTQIAVGFGQIYIRGVASRLYLCINECGRLYGSEVLDENCILRDQMEGNWYNTYTSIKHSTPDKSLFVAFSGGGSPCRLRLGREKASDGRSVVALGSHEKYALFFPVRNVSLPDGMNLTSLIQLNKRLSFARNGAQTTGCAPRCSKLLDQSAKEAKSKRNKERKNAKSSKHVKCRCPAKSACRRRSRHCKHGHQPLLGSPDSSPAEAYNATVPTARWSTVARPGEQRPRLNGTKPARAKPARAKPASHARARVRSEASNKWKEKPDVTSRTPSRPKGGSKKSPTVQLATENGRDTQAPPLSSVRSVVNDERLSSSSRNSKARNHMDFSLRFTHRNGEGRLIRHIYRKIRARPELADQLIALL